MKPSRLSLLLALGLPLGAQSPTDQQKIDQELLDLLNTPVSVASKKAESVAQAPGIVTVISRAELEGFAAKSLGEVMSRVVGTAFLSPDVFSNQSVVVRGQENTPYNNHILVLLNGRPLRDPISGGLNGAIWNAVPLAALDHLEIIRGPGSVLYGSCAYSAVVNLVTRNTKESGLGGSVTLSGGAYGGLGQQDHVTFRDGGFQGMVSASTYRDKGPEYAFTDYDGHHNEHPFDRRTTGVLTNLSYQGFTLNAYQGSFQTYALNGGSEDWDPANYQRQVLSQMDLGYSKELNSLVTLGANVTYNKMNWSTEPVTNPVETSANALLYEGTLQVRPFEGFNIVFGAGGEKASWNGTGLLVLGDQTSSFLYTQLDYRIKAVKLIGGVQYNKLENIHGKASPRLGVVVDFTPEFGGKALYSTAFRKGYPLETGFNHPLFRGNLELKPELISTTEVQVFYQGKTAGLTLTYYSSKTDDTIIRKVLPFATPPPGLPPIYLKYFNGDSWKYSGFELEGKLSLSRGFMVTGSASYQTNENPAGLKDAALHPNTMVKLGAIYQSEDWSLGIFDNYSGAPKPTTLVNPGSLNVNHAAEAFQWITARLSWTPWTIGKNAIKLTLDADNLLGSAIYYPDYPNKTVNTLIPLSAGRSFTLGAGFTF
ncbi:TonB-dependent siderophore receptor [Geothrix sp. PMB-07]|uniref:TonB-dependent receptor plug domain-containing protein n=1 Tax=Geothrix sp. PMB-07 TaxID=3068640 RepID=UPI0027418CC4|nr:TonB-dependent receptor [Geothrix sp. PMB-07]WLT31031.1 TonB-dependent receptor plug domain-containing protein [Geothrix sp. PMB-07]